MSYNPPIINGRAVQPPAPGQYEFGIDPKRHVRLDKPMPMRLRTFHASQVDPVTWSGLTVVKSSEEGQGGGSTEVDSTQPVGKPRWITQWVPDMQPKMPHPKRRPYQPLSYRPADLIAVQMQGPMRHDILTQEGLVDYFRSLFGST